MRHLGREADAADSAFAFSLDCATVRLQHTAPHNVVMAFVRARFSLVRSLLCYVTLVALSIACGARKLRNQPTAQLSIATSPSRAKLTANLLATGCAFKPHCQTTAPAHSHQ